jgi:hypothetical protein
VPLGCCKRDRWLILVARLADGSVVCAGAGKTSDAPLLRSEAQSLTDYRSLCQRVCTAWFVQDITAMGRRMRQPSSADPRISRTGAAWLASIPMPRWSASGIGRLDNSGRFKQSLFAVELPAVTQDSKRCPYCADSGWRCEAHPDLPMRHDDCSEPGEPCACLLGRSIARQLDRLRNVGVADAVSVEADERAELIAAVTRTSEMVGALLDLIDRIAAGFDQGRQLSAADVERLREHSTLWHEQLERLRQRLASVTIEPPTRVQ